MSKQSNEVMAATRNVEPGTGSGRHKTNRPNRDEFVEAKNHADDVLGLDEKVSDGLRRAMARFANSPLTLMMEVLNDPEQPWERRLDAAERAKPYLHRKLEDKHGTQSAGGSTGGSGSSPGSNGPTINLTVNRPRVTVNERQREVEPASKPQQTTSSKHAQAATEANAKAEQKPRPKAFKKPARAKR